MSGLTLGLGLGLRGGAGRTIFDPTNFTVLDSDTNSFSPSNTVLDSAGNSFVVSPDVKDSDGNSFTPI